MPSDEWEKARGKEVVKIIAQNRQKELERQQPEFEDYFNNKLRHTEEGRIRKIIADLGQRDKFLRSQASEQLKSIKLLSPSSRRYLESQREHTNQHVRREVENLLRRTNAKIDCSFLNFIATNDAAKPADAPGDKAPNRRERPRYRVARLLGIIRSVVASNRVTARRFASLFRSLFLKPGKGDELGETKR